MYRINNDKDPSDHNFTKVVVKNYEVKRGAQGLCRNAVNHIKFLTLMAQAVHIVIKKLFCGLDYQYQIVINSIPAETLAVPFWFHKYFYHNFF